MERSWNDEKKIMQTVQMMNDAKPGQIMKNDKAMKHDEKIMKNYENRKQKWKIINHHENHHTS